ncbi:MAG: hypothetical protein MUF07_02435 [Steroidobacteraceae bacterium]|jgi:hypothetical protein|nr:hypothetical protein [Steroidobacteraceae bacterium]
MSPTSEDRTTHGRATASLLGASAASRVAGALALSAIAWLAVWWAW